MARRITDIVTEGEVLGVVAGVAASVSLDQTAADVAFTPTGDLVATDVQAALAELDTEKLAEAGLSSAEITSLLFAEQGSNPATPATGYGRLFIKSNGVYFIDDAGTVTGPFGTTGAAASLAHKFVAGPSGTNHSVTSTAAWADLAASTYDLTLSGVAAGDVLDLQLLLPYSLASGNWFGATVAVNGTASAKIQGLQTSATTGGQSLSIHGRHSLVSGDIVAGSVTVKPQVRVSGGTATVYNEAIYRHVNFSVSNLGPVQT